MSETPFDKLLRLQDEYRRACRWRPSRETFAGFFAFAVVMWIGFTGSPSVETAVGLSVGGLAIVVPIIFDFRASMAANRFHEHEDRMYARVPAHLGRASLAIYGPGDEWRVNAIECHDAHLGGDCPLCADESD